MASPELHARLLDEARNYNPAAQHRSLLDPFRDVILLQRAKFMSYEKIAGTLTRHGVKVSGPGVASYCRRTFTGAEVERSRQQMRIEPRQTMPGPPPAPAAIRPGVPPLPGTRSPRIARDNY